MYDAAEVDALHREVERLRALSEHTERKLRALDAVAAVLASETTLESGMPRVLASLGVALGCAVAALWTPEGEGLELSAQWAADGIEGWSATSRRRILPGSGLA